MEDAESILHAAAGAAKRLLSGLYAQREQLSNELQELQRQINALESIVSGTKVVATASAAEDSDTLKGSAFVRSYPKKLGKGKVDQYIREVLIKELGGLTVDEIFHKIRLQGHEVGKSSIYAALHRNVSGHYSQRPDGSWGMLKVGEVDDERSAMDLSSDQEDEES
jgi:hypothetical protein